MLGIMRKYKQSIVIKIVFAVIVLSFVGTIFLVWGRGEKGAGGSDYAAKVNGRKISVEDYQKSYYRLRGIYEQLNGRGMTPEMEKQLGIRKLALDTLIDTALMKKEASAMGIKVSKNDVAAEIATVAAFQKNGAFDFQIYQERLKSERMTPANFEESVKEELLIRKTREKIQASAAVTDDEALQYFKKHNDKIELSFASFSPADVRKEVKLSEQDLNAYLQGHQDKFKTPEQISLSYCLIEPSSVSGKLTLTDTEAQTFYQKNIDRYQGKGGILPYEEVKERVKTDALQFKSARQAYELAADAINKNKSGDISAAAASLGVKVTDTPLFTFAAPPAQLAGQAEVVKRAFALKPGELGGPVETSRGIYILKIKDRKPSAVPPLAQIRTQVEQGALEDKSWELAKQKAEQSLAEMVKASPGLKLQDTGSFGYSAKGDVPKIGASPEIMEAAFSLTTAAPAAKKTFQVGDRWYVIKLKNRTEINKDAFAREKDQIRQTLLPRKQQEALESWLKNLKAKAKIEVNPAILGD
ncbi:MAG TPA: SurA N-terminal domain-containing protein [Geobacteraceae bacterium]|nr:SurA N-terminal domain-containing protein [Geobacteraceae bacterium]